MYAYLILSSLASKLAFYIIMVMIVSASSIADTLLVSAIVDDKVQPVQAPDSYTCSP